MSLTDQLRAAQLRCLIVNSATLMVHLGEAVTAATDEREERLSGLRLSDAREQLRGYETALRALPVSS